VRADDITLAVIQSKMCSSCLRDKNLFIIALVFGT